MPNCKISIYNNCGRRPSTPPPAEPNIISAVLSNIPEASTYLQVIEAAGLDAELIDVRNATILVPDNLAFTEFLQRLGISLETLLATDTLGDLVLYHWLPGGAYSIAELHSLVVNGGAAAATTLLAGRLIKLSTSTEAPLFFNDFTRIIDGSGDIDGLNGVVIHMMDNVLSPPEPVEPPFIPTPIVR